MSTRAAARVEWVRIDCPLCGADDAEPVYERSHETGSTLGRLPKRDVLCRRCGFMYTNPRPSAADMARYYQDASGASGSIFHSMEPGSRLHGLTGERVAFMGRRIASRFAGEPGAILDIGCAFGDLLAGLELPGWRKAGLEPSSLASRRARERGFEVIAGELESAVLPDRGFEVVACISVLEHVADPVAAVRRIASSLAPGGLAFVEVPDSTRPEAQVAEFFSFEHLSHFTRATLTRCLVDAGLEPVAFDPDVGIPNLRVCAERVDAPRADSAEAIDDRAELVAALSRYRAEREALESELVGRLSTRVSGWSEAGARVALYGAGMHSRFLMGLFDLSDSIACVLDSDPAKAGGFFLRWPIHAPEEIPGLDLDAILISTHAFEQEVFDAIQPTARSCGIEVVRCYS